jgi:glycine oxidase
MSFQYPDVIVVGAGIIGSSIAWRLAQRGLRVQLRDAATMGSQASSAGAGMLAPGGEVSGPSDFGRFLVESLRMYPGFVRELAETTGVAIDYQICGAVESAGSEAEWKELLDRARAQAAMGLRSEPIDERSLYYPDDAIVDPVDVMQALRAACGISGVELVERSPVTRLDTLEAEAVVVSAGAWSGSLEGCPRLPRSFPVKGHLIGYDLEPGSLGRIRRCGHTYLLQRSNGFLLAGSTTEFAGFDTGVDADIVDDVRRRAEDLYPALVGVVPVRAWTGLRPGIEGAGPAIGRFENSRYWLAYGHYRNGILAAPATADRITESLIMGRG